MRERHIGHDLVRGFTLVEMMVVIVILGLLAGMVAPKVMSYFADAHKKTAGLELEIIATSLDEFKRDTGRYPTTEEGLESLLQEPLEIRSWNGPYLKERQQLIDPWDNPYHYYYPGSGRTYQLGSLGADNFEGGSGKDADLIFGAESR